MSTHVIDNTLLSKLTLEQYASLTSELDASPARRELTLRRYGIRDEHDFALLKEAWANHFMKDARGRTQFDQLCNQFSAWLVAHRAER
jgi:hypothetical protein